MMKRIAVVVCMMASAILGFAQTNGREMARLLTEFLAQEEVHPDSIFPSLRNLENKRSQAVSPQERVLYDAVLGRLYAERSYRSQVVYSHTEAPQDSIEEWSQEDYRKASARHFSEALKDLSLLASMSTKDWLPLVQRGKDEVAFGASMLPVVWNAMKACGVEKEGYPLPSYAQMIDFYHAHGLREGALLLELDSIGTLESGLRHEGLLRLSREYADLSLSVKVLRELLTDGVSSEVAQSREHREMRYRKLQEYLKQYPGYKEKTGLQNDMLALRAPSLEFFAPAACISEHTLKVPFIRKDVKGYAFTLYHLPAQVKGKPVDSKELQDAAWLKKHAQMVQRVVGAKPLKDADFETVRDTLQLFVGEPGMYALVGEAQGKVATQNKDNWSVVVIHATRLYPVKVTRDDKEYLSVVDALTGTPLPQVEVSVAWSPMRGRGAVLHSHYRTDEQGNVVIDKRENYQGKVSLVWKNDSLPDVGYISLYRNGSVADPTSVRFDLNTDRAIYCPGQTVHFSGVVYTQKGWDAHVSQGRKVVFRLRDPETNMLMDTTLVTDDFGCVSLDFQLPSAGKLGRYRLMLGTSSKSIRVEEYKRPTFEVLMDEPVLANGGITFKGQARTYAGIPVRNARVTGEYSWSRGGFLYQGFDAKATPIDTLWTDENGRFTVTVPDELTKEEKRLGRWVLLRADVLSGKGETQTGSKTASLCSTPLRILTEVKELQDKEQLPEMKFVLYDALGKEVNAPVSVELWRAGSRVLVTQLEAGKSRVAEEFAQLASGAYTLRAQAVVKGDTARTSSRVVLFSLQDHTLPTDTTSWFYTPSLEISEDKPACIQVGSSLKDVSLYCIAVANDKVLQKRIVHLSDELTTLAIPYEKGMGQNLTVVLYFVKDGKLYRETLEFKKPKPDYKLKAHWTTFRDKLRPGQQETWVLSLRRPDGTPAEANLMATLYDASLDAFEPHPFKFWLSRNDYGHYVTAYSLYSSVSHRESIPLSLKMKKEYEWRFSCLDDKYFEPRFMTVNSNSWRYQTRRAGVFEESRNSAPLMYAKASGAATKQLMAKESAVQPMMDASMKSRVAEMDAGEATAESVAETDENGKQESWASLRTNFNETAFFYPQLRTNEDGEVTLAFTLPESLTRWHLLGLAHTSDMLTAELNEHIVAQKELMAQLLLPRFLRVGDEANLTATIQNIDADRAEKGTAVFEILNAKTEKVLMRRKVRFDLAAGQDTVLYFMYKVQNDDADLLCRWKAEGQDCSDGEQRLLPVLSNREKVLTTKALTLQEKGKRDYDLKNLFPADATKRSLVLEYTTHPVWCAIQSLPTLLHPQDDCVLCQAGSYYALSLSQHLSEQVPEAKEVLGLTHDSIALNIALSLDKLAALQTNDGCFIWFPGMQGSAYLTREVAFLLVRLQRMTGSLDEKATRLLNSSITYLRSQLRKEERISTATLRHLYVVSMANLPLEKVERELLGQLGKTSTEWSLEDRALAAIVLHLQDKDRATNRMMEGVEKYLVGTSQTGRYIDYPSGSFTSIDRKLQIHAQIMEAVRMVRPEDKVLWTGMQQYLLNQKRTTDWGNAVNTASAVYELMQGAREDLKDKALDRLTVKGGRETQAFVPQRELSGYMKDTVWVKTPQTLRVEKNSVGESWGAVYAEYEQQVDSVDAQWEGVNIRREWSKVSPKVGDRIHIRYVITAKRDYDYVKIRAPRAALAEVQTARSGYRYSNGLGYYCAVHDDATEYFISHLPKGKYVLEEEVVVERPGTYSAGITTIQCLYAPEFSARTQNLKISGCE